MFTLAIGNQLIKPKQLIKLCAEAAGINPEWLTFVNVPILNQIFILSKRLFKGDRADIKTYHSYKALYSEDELKEIANELVNNYKIHLCQEPMKKRLKLLIKS